MDEKVIHRTNPYSLDLRQVAMRMMHSSSSIQDIAPLLKVSVTTLYRWAKRLQLAAFSKGGLQAQSTSHKFKGAHRSKPW